MNCDWVRQSLLLYTYDELPDDARYEVEQHLARCPECAGELKLIRDLHGKLSAFSVHEPSPNLVTSSRMRLQEALETVRQGGLWQRFTFDPAAWLRQMKFAPALAAIIFIVGFAGGIGATYQILGVSHNTNQAALNPSPAEASIRGIRSITKQPGTDQVSIKYDTISTQEAQGSLNDQRIQQLLLFASHNNYNSGVRMDSVNLLTQSPDDLNAREALAYALRYDSNPGVRLKALAGLAPFVTYDVRARDAVLEALLNDSNPGIRIQALQMLEPCRADGSVRVVLERLAGSDDSKYIRSQARTMLAQTTGIY
jgi:HEAT repeats/Putative zinc-finger